MSFSFFSAELNRYIFPIDSTMTSTKTSYLESSIRRGFTSEDVRLWQALCRQCETNIGDSHKYMHFILDVAKHNDVEALDIIKTGRLCSEQKSVNQKFIEALMLAVCDDGDAADVDDDVDDKQAVKAVLDLTADEDSGSYEEEERKGPFDHDDTPNSAEAYEIDGFVVHDDEPEVEAVTKQMLRKSIKILTPHESVTRVTPHGLARRSSLVETPAGAVALKASSLKKRVLESISEEE